MDAQHEDLKIGGRGAHTCRQAGRAEETSFRNADSYSWNKRTWRESGVGAAKFQFP